MQLGDPPNVTGDTIHVLGGGDVVAQLGNLLSMEWISIIEYEV